MSTADIALEIKRKELEDAISRLVLAKSMETEAEALKAEAIEVIIPFMKLNNLKSYKSDLSMGKVGYTAPGVTKKFSKEKAAQELLLCGVAADVIQKCYDIATEEKPRAGFVKFTLDKS